jgi:hypothetical protein
VSARLTACTPLLSLVHQSKELPWRHWSVGVSFTNVIIRHERLSHDTAEWSCLLLVEHSHFAFVNADGSHSPLLRYISDYSPRLHPLGAPLAITISSITSINSSARLCRVRDFAFLIELRPQVHDVHRLRCSHTDLGVLPACRLFQ